MVKGDLEKFNLILQAKYMAIQQKEQRYKDMFLDDAEIILVAYGTMARIARALVYKLRKKGQKIGFIRPITLWPFPTQIFKRLMHNAQRKTLLTIEMSYGQMLEDVKLAVNGEANVEFLGRSGGGIPTEEEIVTKIKLLLKG